MAVCTSDLSVVSYYIPEISVFFSLTDYTQYNSLLSPYILYRCFKVLFF